MKFLGPAAAGPGVDAATVTTRTNRIGAQDAVLVTMAAPTQGGPEVGGLEAKAAAHTTPLPAQHCLHPPPGASPRFSITNVLFGLFRPDESVGPGSRAVL